MEDFTLKPGAVLGGSRYRIEEKKAAGGFGIVYAATDTLRGERVAVKELFWREHSVRDADGRVRLGDAADEKEYAGVRAAFDAEAKTLVRLEHVQGIVHCRDAFEENGTAYIVMDDVEGVTLARQNREQDKRPDAAGLMRRFLPLMESIAEIHDAGIIHRDVSPENIMVSPDGKLTLIDFGSAGTYRREEDERFTTIAKDGFAPEEQYRAGARQGPYSDVYGLCATMYTCLTGAVPDSARARRIMDDLEAPSALGVKIPGELEAVLMRGLAVDAANRYADMRALIAAVKRALMARTLRAVRMGLLAALIAAAVGFGAWRTAMFLSDDTTPAGNLIQATWENPALAEGKGKNQVRAAALDGETQACLYTFYGADGATQGEREDLIRILKERLDTLGTPYAFDAEAVSEGRIAIRLPKDRLSSFVLSSLTDNHLYVTGEDILENITVSYSRNNAGSDLTVVDTEDGGYALRCVIGDDFSFDDVLEGMMARGEDTLYLRDRDGHAVAQAPLAGLQDGVIEFRELRFEGAAAMNADTRFVADYIHTLVNTPPLPFTGSLEAREALDGEGAALENTAAQAGMRMPRTPADEALVSVLRSIYTDTGYLCTESTGGTLFIHVDLPVDEALPGQIAAVTERLLGSYPLSEQLYNHSLIIALIDEVGDERCRVVLSRRIALDDTPGERNEITGYLFTSERLEPYKDAINAWWQGLPDVYHGFGVMK